MTTTLQTLNPDFTSFERSIICDAVNWCGDDDHPRCDTKTMPHFGVSYVLTCLTKFIKITGSDTEFAFALCALDAIKNARQGETTCVTK